MNFRIRDGVGLSFPAPPPRSAKQSHLFRIRMALYRFIGVDFNSLPWTRLLLGSVIGILLHSELHSFNLSDSGPWKNWIPIPIQNLTIALFSGQPFSVAEIFGFILLLLGVISSPLARALQIGQGPKKETLHRSLLVFVCLAYPSRLVWTSALSWFFVTRIISQKPHSEIKRSAVLRSLGFDVESDEQESARLPMRLLLLLLLSVFLDGIMKVAGYHGEFVSMLPIAIACTLIALLGIPRKSEEKPIE